MQVCAGCIARVAELGELGAALGFLMQAYTNASLLQMGERYVGISGNAHSNVFAGYGLHRNWSELSRGVVRNAIDSLGHFSVGDRKHGLTKAPEILVTFP